MSFNPTRQRTCLEALEHIRELVTASDRKSDTVILQNLRIRKKRNIKTSLNESKSEKSHLFRFHNSSTCCTAAVDYEMADGDDINCFRASDEKLTSTARQPKMKLVSGLSPSLACSAYCYLCNYYCYQLFYY
jgi:hypothetical protein